jgi:hypothetical protein
MRSSGANGLAFSIPMEARTERISETKTTTLKRTPQPCGPFVGVLAQKRGPSWNGVDEQTLQEQVALAKLIDSPGDVKLPNIYTQSYSPHSKLSQRAPSAAVGRIPGASIIDLLDFSPIAIVAVRSGARVVGNVGMIDDTLGRGGFHRERMALSCVSSN